MPYSEHSSAADNSDDDSGKEHYLSTRNEKCAFGKPISGKQIKQASARIGKVSPNKKASAVSGSSAQKMLISASGKRRQRKKAIAKTGGHFPSKRRKLASIWHVDSKPAK